MGIGYTLPTRASTPMRCGQRHTSITVATYNQVSCSYHTASLPEFLTLSETLSSVILCSLFLLLGKIQCLPH